MDILNTTNAWLLLVIVVGGLILLGLIATSSSPSSLKQRQAAAKKHAAREERPAPVVQPLALKVAPKIYKVEKTATVEVPKPEIAPPTLEVKSLEIAAPVEIAPVAVEEIVAAVEEAADEAPAKKEMESTFEAYRTAMLSSGPRSAVDAEAGLEMQMKGRHANSAQWRDQTSSLRAALKDQNTADFLDMANVSINDRMVAIFDSVKN